MKCHATPEVDGFDPPCGAYVTCGDVRLQWRGPYHDAAALDAATATQLAWLARWHLTQLAMFLDQTEVSP